MLCLPLLASCSTRPVSVKPAPSLLIKCSLPAFDEKAQKLAKFVRQTAIYVGAAEQCKAKHDGLIEYHKKQG